MRLRGSWLGCRLATWVPTPVWSGTLVERSTKLDWSFKHMQAWLSSRREKPAWSVRPNHRVRAVGAPNFRYPGMLAGTPGPGALPTVGADRRPRSWGRDRLAPQAVRLSSGQERDDRRDHWRNTFESWNGEALPNLRPAAEW